MTAGKALGVSPRTVQTYIRKGLLQGKVEGDGVRRTWYVSIDSLNALRAQRLAEDSAETFPEGSAGQVAEGIAEAMQNISERLAEEAARAAEYRVRLELTELAESTLREDLQRERERADRLEGERARREQAEHERDVLLSQLEGLQEARKATETTSDSEGEARGDAPGEDPDEPPDEPRRSWWRRYFGG